MRLRSFSLVVALVSWEAICALSLDPVGCKDQNSVRASQEEGTDFCSIRDSVSLLTTQAVSRIKGAKDSIAMNSIRKPLAWLHVHHVAGTSMCFEAKLNGEIVSEAVGDCQMGRFDYLGSQRPTCTQRESAVQEQKITFFEIEREFDAEDYCPEQFYYGMAVRDPIGLAESRVNHNESSDHNQPSGSGYTEVISCLTDDSCFDLTYSSTWDMWLFFDNYLVRTLGGPHVMRLPPRGVNASHAQKAVEAIAKFNMSVRLEDLGKKLVRDLFRKEFGWQKFQYLRQPANHESTGVRFSDQERQQIRELAKYDYAVYNQISTVLRDVADVSVSSNA